MQLIVGNKNYSSWSMRPWVLLRTLGIGFNEQQLRFDFTPGSPFYAALKDKTPVARVPVLVEDDGPCQGLSVWDSLAIIEYLAERHPEHAIWPRDPRQRALARSLCAEMHAGFGALRRLCPMNIEAYFPEIGQDLLRTEPGLVSDLQRVDAIWSGCVSASGGPFLFGEFGAADAYFAPVVMRVTRFALPLSEASRAYAQRVEQASGVREWVAGALAEHDFVEEDEPYRQRPA